MTTENIDIRVSEDGSRVVRRRLDDIADGADRSYNAVDRLNSILKMVGRYLAVTEVMRWADAWSIAASSIKIATSNSYEFVQVQSELFKIAQRSRQEFGALAELYAAVARQSENLQTSQKGLLLYTENISKALAIQHTSMSAARGPLLQLGQAMASGTIRAQEFNSIMLGLPYVMKIVAENFKGGSVSIMQLRQMMLQGKLESKEFFEAFQRGTEQINKDFDKTQVTFSQAFTIFKNELVKFTGTMDSTTGAATKFAAVLKFVAENLALLTTAAAAMALGMKFGPIIAGFLATRTAAADAAAAVVAANLQMTASENAKALANIETARAVVASTQADLASVAATQAAIVVSREAAIATLAKANSDIIAARASLQAATNAGALSYALAVKREAELALVAAEARRSASLAELAVLGQQQARVTVIQTEATAAHTAAVRALTVAQGMGAEASAAYTISQGAAAAATSRIGIAAGAATIATRLFSGAVALMGGPIGIAITALAALGMWLYSVKSNADEAKAAIDAVNRVNAAKAGGPGVRQSDAEKIQQAYEKARKEKEAAEDAQAKFEENLASKRARGYTKEADELQKKFGKTFQDDVDKATESVNKFSKAMEEAKDLSIETGGAAGKAARELGNARAAWEASNKGVKTATGIQEAYRDELDKSRAAHKSYIEQLRKTNTDGVNDKEIARANRVQQEAEASMAKERDAALTRLNNLGAASKKQIQLDVDERMSLINSALDNELSVRNKAYEADKRMLDAKHQNGLVSEATYMAQNLQMVQRYEEDERAIIQKASEDQRVAYEARRKYIQDTLSGKRESDELKKLDADYAKFVDSVNAKLAKLDISVFERQTTAIFKLSGELNKLSAQDDKYWNQANANADKEQAVAEAKRKLAFATEEQQAAYEAYMKTGEQHNAQLNKLEDAYYKAKQEADDFSASIDWREAGADTIAILDAMNSNAEGFALRLEAAYAKLDQLKNRAAASAAEAVRNKEYNKNISDIADAIETAIFDGGKAGGKKFTDWLKNYFLRNPIRVLLQGTLSLLGNALGLGGGAGGVAGGGGAMGLVSNASSAISLGSRAYGMFQGGFGGTIGGISFGSGTGAAAGATAVNGLSALTPVTIGTNTSAVTGVSAGGAAGGGFGSSAMAALPWVAGGLLVANALGLFRTTKKVGNGMMGTLGKEGGVHNYDLIRKSGTLFSGPSYKYKDTGVSENDKVLQETYLQMRTNAVAMGKTLGLDTSKAEKFTTQFGRDTIHPDTGGQGIVLDGLTQQEAEAKIQDALMTANNDIAEQIIGTWETTSKVVKEMVSTTIGTGEDAYTRWEEVDKTITETTYTASKYAKENEKAIDTLTRLSTSLAVTNKVFDTLGQTAFDASLAGGDLASKLIDLFGGADAFVAAANSYYESYYTEEERRAIQTRQVTEELKKYNIAMPKSRDEFRKLVESQDLTTEEGRKMYHVLMTIAPAFAEITNAAEDAAEAAAAAMSVLEGSTDKAFASLEASINKQIAALEASKAPVEARINALNEIFGILDSALKNLIGSIDSTVAQSYTQGRAYLDAAAANPSGVGTLNKDELNNAVSGVSGGLVTDNFKSKTDYDRERLTVAGQYEKLRDATKDQMSIEQQTLDGINQQISKLQDVLKLAQLQLDQLRGIDTSVISVADAIIRFQTAWAAENAARNKNPNGTTGGAGGKPGFGPGDNGSGDFSVGPGGSGTVKEIKPGMKTSDGRFYVEQFFGPYGSAFNAADDNEQTRLESIQGAAQKAWADAAASGNIADLFTSLKAQGITLTEAAALYGFYYEDVYKASEAAGVGRFADGGMHPGGLRIVGERGWEMEATGPARIWNQSQLGDALAMGLTNSGSVAEEDTYDMMTTMEGVSTEIDNLRRVSYNFGRSQTVALRDMLKLMKKNDTIGLPPTRSAEDG